MEQKDIIHILQNVIRKEWNRQALTDFNGESLQYKDLGRKIAKLHLLFEHTGIKPGDKIALCGKNSAQWAVSFFAIMSYGAVVVPLLHEFKPDNLHHLVNHSDARLLFVDSHIYENLDPELMPDVEGIVRIHDFSLFFSRNEQLNRARAHLNEYFGQKYPERFTPDDVKYFEVANPDSLALINYTSGSTGFSKGVMVPHRAIWSNVEAILNLLHDLPKSGDSMVCMLPMAHMYGLVIDMCHGICKGAHLYFLTRQPSPKVLIEAFRTARPRLIITVPLIIEKIIKTKVFPTLERPLNRLLLHTPLIDKKVLEKVRAALMETFGGQLEMMIVGGAGLNRDVEEFLHRINFPVTVGYGMTECAPPYRLLPRPRNPPRTRPRIHPDIVWSRGSPYAGKNPLAGPRTHSRRTHGQGRQRHARLLQERAGNGRSHASRRLDAYRRRRHYRPERQYFPARPQ